MVLWLCLGLEMTCLVAVRVLCGSGCSFTPGLPSSSRRKGRWEAACPHDWCVSGRGAEGRAPSQMEVGDCRCRSRP